MLVVNDTKTQLLVLFVRWVWPWNDFYFGCYLSCFNVTINGVVSAWKWLPFVILLSLLVLSGISIYWILLAVWENIVTKFLDYDFVSQGRHMRSKFVLTSYNNIIVRNLKLKSTNIYYCPCLSSQITILMEYVAFCFLTSRFIYG